MLQNNLFKVIFYKNICCGGPSPEIIFDEKQDKIVLLSYSTYKPCKSIEIQVLENSYQSQAEGGGDRWWDGSRY